MNKLYLFADIGNSTIDFLITDFQSQETKKINPKDEREISSYLDSLKEVDECYISSVDKVGYSHLVSSLEKKNIPYHTLDVKKMDSFAKENGYIVENTSFLGPDLYCDIMARDSSTGLIIIDLGTASKILYLDSEKKFHGACIFPGVALFPEMLNQKTDLLDFYSLDLSPELVSLQTKECISSGAINGVSALIAGMVENMKKKYSCPDAKVVLTGGNGYLIKNVLTSFGLQNFETDLCIVNEGLARIYGFEDYMKMKKEIK